MAGNACQCHDEQDPHHVILAVRGTRLQIAVSHGSMRRMIWLGFSRVGLVQHRRRRVPCLHPHRCRLLCHRGRRSGPRSRSTATRTARSISPCFRRRRWRQRSPRPRSRQGQTAALLARLEPLPTLDNARPAVMRPPSAKPATSGTAMPIAFVAPTGRAVADRPMAPAAIQPGLDLPMQAPQILPAGGDVVLEAELRVRFVDPMVAVAEVGAARGPIATIDPPIAGAWRWNDTREAQFTPAAGRLPGSTKITVTVPAGARSVTNTILDAPVTATFTTPTVTIDSTYPREQMLADAPIALRLNQQVDRDVLAKLLRLTVNKTELPFRAISLDEARPLWLKAPHLRVDFSAIGDLHVILAPDTPWPTGRDGHVTLAGARRRARARASAAPRGRDVSRAPKFELAASRATTRARNRLPGAVSAPATSRTRSRRARTTPNSCARRSPIEDHRGRQRVHSDAAGRRRRPLTSRSAMARRHLGQPFAGPHHLSFETRGPRREYLSAETGLYVLDPRFADPAVDGRRQAIATLRVQLYQRRTRRLLRVRGLRAGARTDAAGHARRRSASTRSARGHGARRASICAGARPRGTRPRDRGRDSGPQRRGGRLDRGHASSASSRASTATRPTRGSATSRRRAFCRRSRARARRSSTDDTLTSRRSRPTRRGTRRSRMLPPVPRRRRPIRLSRDALHDRAARDRTADRLGVRRDVRRCASDRARAQRAVVRDRRSLHVQAGRDGLRQGLGALDDDRRQPRPRAARDAATRSTYALHDASRQQARERHRAADRSGRLRYRGRDPGRTRTSAPRTVSSRRTTQTTRCRSRSRSSARRRTRSTLDRRRHARGRDAAACSASASRCAPRRSTTRAAGCPARASLGRAG